MVISSSKPDVHLLANVLMCLDFCMDSRLLSHASMKASDIKRVLKLTEALGNMVFSHRSWLQERCPSSKERCVAIKNTFRDV